jgi:hypothetical protein
LVDTDILETLKHHKKLIVKEVKNIPITYPLAKRIVLIATKNI